MNEVTKWLWYTDLVISLFPALAILATINIGIAIVSFFCWVNTDGKCKGIYLGIITIFIAMVLTIMLILLPSERTMLFITASHATNQVMQTQNGQKAIAVLDKKLDEYLKENH